MARLIDADTLHDFVSEEFKDDVPYEWAWALTVVDHAPTVDAVEVVRCKDCAVPHNKYTGCPKLNGLVTPPDFFCPFGEQKKENDE